MVSASRFLRNRYLNRLKKERNMTICIAAIAESDTNTPKIVFCADRMQTTSISTETSTKIEPLGRAVILHSGRTSICHAIIERGRKKLNPEKFYSTEELAEIFTIAAKEQFKKIVEEQLLNSKGKTFDEFYTNISSFARWWAKPIDDEIERLEENYNEECVSLIVAGIDESGAHIYEINGNGSLEHKNFRGFAIIGSGSILSLPEITKNKYTHTLPLPDVFYRVFTAKKMAEHAANTVGKETDIGILHIGKDKNGNPAILKWDADDEFKRALDKVFSNMQDEEIKYINAVTKDLGRYFYPEEEKTKQTKA